MNDRYSLCCWIGDLTDEILYDPTNRVMLMLGHERSVPVDFLFQHHRLDVAARQTPAPESAMKSISFSISASNAATPSSA